MMRWASAVLGLGALASCSVRDGVGPDKGLLNRRGAEGEPRDQATDDPLPEGAVVRLGTARSRHGAVVSVVYSPRGMTVFSTSADGTSRMWDAVRGCELWSMKREVPEGLLSQDPFLQAAFSPDGRILAVAAGRLIRLLDAATGKEFRTLKLGLASIGFYGHWGLSFSADGRTIRSVGARRELGIWNVSTGEARVVDGKSTCYDVRAAAFSPDGKTVAVAWIGSGETIPTDRFNCLELVDCDTGATVHRVRAIEDAFDCDPQSAGVTALTWSPDGRLVAFDTSDWDPTVIEVDRLKGRPPGEEGTEWIALQPLWRPGPWGRDGGRRSSGRVMGFSPDSRLLAAAGPDCVIWDLATGHRILRLDGDWVRSLAYSPDGSRLAVGGADGTVLIWDLFLPLPVPAQLGPLWEDLGTADGEKAWRAVRALVAAGDAGAAFLARCLRLASSPGAESLVEKLEVGELGERQRASEALRKLGIGALGALCKAVVNSKAPEAQARALEILGDLEGPFPKSPGALQWIRTLQVLERMRTTQACALLMKFGTPASRGAFKRLKDRK